ncbi:MAG: rhodanese-like domain-containing protein [Pseudomonadota bacterium]
MNTRVPTRAAFCAVTLLAASTALAADPSYGNRYGLERYYHSEISAAKAFLLTHYDRGNVSRDAFRNAVLIDVRTIPEYVAGHPDMALNIPYPHINTTNTKDPQYIAQNPKTFFDTVASRIPDRDTPILTLSCTGHRSVLAANILADPGRYIPEYQGKVPGYKSCAISGKTSKATTRWIPPTTCSTSTTTASSPTRTRAAGKTTRNSHTP